MSKVVKRVRPPHEPARALFQATRGRHHWRFGSRCRRPWVAHHPSHSSTKTSSPDWSVSELARVLATAAWTAWLLDVCDGGIFWSDALISTGVLVSEKGHPSWKAGHFSLASSTSSPALAKGHSLGGAAILLQQFGAPQQGSPNSKAGEGRRAGLRPPGAPVGPAKPCAVRRVEMRRALVQRKLAFFIFAPIA